MKDESLMPLSSKLKTVVEQNRFQQQAGGSYMRTNTWFWLSYVENIQVGRSICFSFISRKKDQWERAGTRMAWRTYSNPKFQQMLLTMIELNTQFFHFHSCKKTGTKCRHFCKTEPHTSAHIYYKNKFYHSCHFSYLKIFSFLGYSCPL